MFNAQRIETLRQKIQASTLLSDHEKGDWLNLLDLMNDKQLGELEEILASGGSAATISSLASEKSSLPASVSKLPQLSHIANIPTNIHLKEGVGATVKPVNTIPTVKLPPLKPISVKPVNPVKSFSQPSADHATSPASARKPAFSIETLEDIKDLNPEVLRKFDLQSVVDIIRSAIQEHGYFHILQLLEASSLYGAYIQSGTERLKAQGQPVPAIKTDLTQAEFEFMTDLLSHMRFNRW
jgi:hypothetical protein